MNGRFVLLTNKWPKKLTKPSDNLSVKADNTEVVQTALKSFYDNISIQKLVLVHDDIEILWQMFKEQFEIVKAAGGLVVNGDGNYLFIHRRGFWDLPKGKLDKGENLKSCAVREVEEECGISDIELKEKICVTYHIYGKKERPLLKPSHWYLMKVKGNPKLTPQKEEDINKAKWIKPKKVRKLLPEAFPSIRLVMEAYEDLISS